MAGPYFFGRFALDPAERQLYAGGESVSLGAIGFRLLLALVERAGNLVTKDELIERVWGHPDVEDSTLYVHMAALRKIVGDDCFVSKQGRGYRFIAPVQRFERHQPNRNEPKMGNLASRWTNDPATGPTRLVGRREELRQIADLLARSRLVTLTGPGGVGKTRLAVEAAKEFASQFRDGVWLVQLAPLSDPDLVPGAVASAVGAKVGVNTTPVDALARLLARKSALIVIDNCEQLIGSVASFSEALLASTGEVKIIATSREPLSCSEEVQLEVPPLALPNDGAFSADPIRSAAAIELFIERAVGADRNFRIDDEGLRIAARICRRVDGLPLAIEMVAAWAGVLVLETLDTRLDGSLKDWLRARATAPARHSTLRATLEWSYGLLTPSEQTVLGRLSVFAGYFNLEGAEAVASSDLMSKEHVLEHIASLVRKSLIALVPGSRVSQYRLLETTRVFMLEKLALSNDGASARQQHANYVLCTLEQADRELETTSDPVWLRRYGPVLDDVRVALDWAMQQQTDDAVALAGASWPLWRELSLRAEGRQRLSAAIARLRADTPALLEARLRHGLGVMLLNSSAGTAALEEIERAVTIQRGLDSARDLGTALIGLANVFLMLNRNEDAERAIHEALNVLEPEGLLRTLAIAYCCELCIEAVRGNADAARLAGKRAARISEIVGAERTTLLVAINLMQLNLEIGDVHGAVQAGRQATERLRDTSHSDIRGFALGVLTAALTAHGDLDEALATAREAAPMLRDEGAVFWLFDHLALRSALAGRAKDAALLSGYANAIHQTLGRSREPMGVQAIERADLLLCDTLPFEEIAELNQLGARLSEEQAMAIALG